MNIVSGRTNKSSMWSTHILRRSIFQVPKRRVERFTKANEKADGFCFDAIGITPHTVVGAWGPVELETFDGVERHDGVRIAFQTFHHGGDAFDEIFVRSGHREQCFG